MRNSLSNVFSYLFMIASFICIISAFSLLVILVRYFMIDIGPQEKQIAKLFVVIFISTIILAPTLYYISYRLEKYSGRMKEV